MWAINFSQSIIFVFLFPLSRRFYCVAESPVFFPPECTDRNFLVEPCVQDLYDEKMFLFYADGHWLRPRLGPAGPGAQVPVSVPADAVLGPAAAQEPVQALRLPPLRRRAGAGAHAPPDAHHRRLHVLHQRVHKVVRSVPGWKPS